MTSQGNGQPIRYNVQLAGLTRELLRKLHGQQAKIGRGQQFVSAFRQIVLRLQREPLEFGEPLYRLPALRLLVRQGAISPLVVDYAVHEDNPLVFISRVALLP
jgi:hypothetical protein